MAHVEVRSPKVYKSSSPFSHATKTQGTTFLHITGQAAQDSRGGIVGKGDVEVQTTQALENMKALLEEAGGTMADVARIRIYVTSREYLEKIKAVRRRYFSEPYPATTVVQVVGLDDPDWLVEIEATAVL